MAAGEVEEGCFPFSSSFFFSVLSSFSSTGVGVVGLDVEFSPGLPMGSARLLAISILQENKDTTVIIVKRKLNHKNSFNNNNIIEIQVCYAHVL